MRSVTGLLRAASVSVIVAGVATGAGAADLSAFDGRWVMADDLDWCGNTSGETDEVPLVFRLTGLEPAIEGYESACAIAEITPIHGVAGASLVLECAGEGMTWTERSVLLLNDPDTVTIYTASDDTGGSTSTRIRCP
jgi:hypothetical protein